MKIRLRENGSVLAAPSEVFIGETGDDYVFLDKHTSLLRSYSKEDWEIIDLGGRVGDTITIKIEEPMKI